LLFAGCRMLAGCWLPYACWLLAMADGGS
jgi:hypothetical protein